MKKKIKIKPEMSRLDLLISAEWSSKMEKLAKKENLPLGYFLRVRLTERVRNIEYEGLPDVPFIGIRTKRMQLQLPVDVKEKLINIKNNTGAYSLAQVIAKIAGEERE